MLMIDLWRIFFRYYEFLSKTAKCMAVVWGSWKGRSLELRSWQIKASQIANSALMTGKVSRSKNNFLRMLV